MIKYDGLDEAIIGPAFIWRDQTQVEVLVYDAVLVWPEDEYPAD